MKHKTDPKMRDAEAALNDRLDAAAIDYAYGAAVLWLKACSERNPAREIRKLTKTELRLLAINVISAYITRRSQQVALATIDDLLTSGETQSPLQ